MGERPPPSFGRGRPLPVRSHRQLHSLERLVFSYRFPSNSSASFTSSPALSLPRVLEIVRDHGEALDAAGRILEVTEGKDAIVLAMVGERALKAADALFAIENVRGVQGHARMPEFGDSVQVQLSMCTLPPLALAVEAAATNPHGVGSGASTKRNGSLVTSKSGSRTMTHVGPHNHDFVLRRDPRNPLRHAFFASAVSVGSSTCVLARFENWRKAESFRTLR